MDKYEFDEKYAGLEADYFPEERRQRRKGKKRSRQEVIEEIRPDGEDVRYEVDIDETTFDPSYMRDKKEDYQERLWLIENLQEFYDEEYIIDVTHHVKGGKEASVFCCVAHPTLETPYVAAKLYRPAIFRSLKNDAQYRAGRFAGRDEGVSAEMLLDARTSKAMRGRTKFGRELLIGTWIGHEYEMLQKLYDAGVNLPEPIGFKNHAILMEYMGEGHIAAPPLHYIRLEKEEAQPFFNQIMNDVVTMLAHDCIHGDLSAYNILYWEGEVKIIDFPQAVNPWYNPDALTILQRDITRVCQYFARYKVVDATGNRPDPVAITMDLWERYMANEL